MTSPPPLGPGPNADAIANTARIAAEQAVAQQVGQVATFLAGGGLASDAVDDLSWQVNRLAEIARLRKQLALSSLDAQKTATAQIPALLGSVAQEAAGGLDVQLGGLADELVQALTAMWDRTPALLAGSAQTIVSNATAQVRVGNLTRVQATAQAADRLVAQGISPALDRAGRRWTAPAYTEMRVRTGVMDAGRTGRETQALRFGTPYVQVSDALRECPMCRPWEGKILTLDGTDPDELAQGTLAEARAAGLGHPNCFPSGTLVQTPSGVRAADRRRYEGDLVVIHTASGVELACTPNHPVLTPEGWVAAGSLVVGQSVLRDSGQIGRGSAANPHDEQVPTAIGQVFDALRQSSQVASVRVPSAAEQFHGDGEGSEVDVVLADSLLRVDGQPQAGHLSRESQLLLGGVGEVPLLAGGPLSEVFAGAGHASHGVMGGLSERGSLCRAHAGQASLHGFAATDLSASITDDGADRRLADSVGGRDLALSLAGVVTLDDVVGISHRDHADHVFNLETGNGWYLAQGIVVHNCRHLWAPYFPAYSSRVQPTPDPSGWEASKRQRELERRVRAAKLRQQTADTIDPGGLTAQAAKTRVREAQRLLREHVKATGQRRKPDRERVPQAS